MGKRRQRKANDLLGERPYAVDGSTGELVVRRIVVWRRLEPGDERTPGTELAPENEHLESLVVEVGIAPALRDDMVRIGRVKERTLAHRTSWAARYEPAGALLSVGGGVAVGTWLDFLPGALQPAAGSLVVIGACVGWYTRRRRHQVEAATVGRWKKTPEYEESERIEKTLRPRWERFSTRLREETGFRVDVRIGAAHEAERLRSLDPEALGDASTWLPDQAEDEVRYGWVYADDRIVQQVAILEGTDNEVDSNRPSAPAPEEE